MHGLADTGKGFAVTTGVIYADVLWIFVGTIEKSCFCFEWRIGGQVNKHDKLDGLESAP